MIQVKVKPAWGVIHELIERIKNTLAGYSERVIYSSEITASELMENALKYGHSNEDLPEILFEFQVKDNKILIHVSNGIQSQESIQTFLKIFDQIKIAENRQDLYIQKLREALETPSITHSQLGFYKILYETDFLLDYILKGNALTIIAELELKEGDKK